MIVDSAGCADFSVYRHDMYRTPLYGICYMWHWIRETRGATLCGGVLGESLMRTWSQSCVSPLRLKRGRADKGTCCCCLGQESTCVLLHMDCGEVELSVQESSTHIVTTNTKLSQSTLWNKHKLRCKSDVVETNYPNILLRLTQNQPEIASF